MTIEEEALQLQQKAHAIIQETNLIPIWESIGAEIRQVGSLRMGLLMKHCDIDFHIYFYCKKPNNFYLKSYFSFIFS